MQHRAGNTRLCPWTQTGRPLGAQAGWRGRGLGPGGPGALLAQAVFLVGSEREAYLAGEPANDARFIAVLAHALEHTGSYAPEEATRVAGTLLPDILSYDPTRPASFPDNGRTLTDDAAYAFLAVLTDRKVTGDKVGPHNDLLAEFPYLGPPHDIFASTNATLLIATELRKASRRPGSS